MPAVIVAQDHNSSQRSSSLYKKALIQIRLLAQNFTPDFLRCDNRFIGMFVLRCDNCFIGMLVLRSLCVFLFCIRNTCHSFQSLPVRFSAGGPGHLRKSSHLTGYHIVRQPLCQKISYGSFRKSGLGHSKSTER